MISEAEATLIGEIAGGGGNVRSRSRERQTHGPPPRGRRDDHRPTSGTFAGFGSYQIGGGGHWALNGSAHGRQPLDRGRRAGHQRAKPIQRGGGVDDHGRRTRGPPVLGREPNGERGHCRFRPDRGSPRHHSNHWRNRDRLGHGGHQRRRAACADRVQFGGNLRFGGGTLDLAQSQTFTVMIGMGLADADTLDLDDVAFTGGNQTSFSGTATGGVLTVTDGTVPQRLCILLETSRRAAPSASQATALAASTSHSRTRAPAAHAFVAAMACHGPMTPVGMSSSPPHAQAAPPASFVRLPRAFAL